MGYLSNIRRMPSRAGVTSRRPSWARSIRADRAGSSEGDTGLDRFERTFQIANDDQVKKMEQTIEIDELANKAQLRTSRPFAA